MSRCLTNAGGRVGVDSGYDPGGSGVAATPASAPERASGEGVRRTDGPRSRPGSVAGIAAAASILLLTACGGPPDVPAPRPLIVHSGARLTPTHDRLREIDRWIRPQLQDIREDPSFLIRTIPRDTTVYPWSDVEIVEDTVNIAMRRGLPEARIPYLIYAHLQIMDRRGELEEWLPEAADAAGFDLELAILRRTADAWLYGRSAWDAPPYEALDEITYARENDYLEPLIFVSRPDQFAEARRSWVAENPGGIEEYRRWFVETFGREPPGLREEAADGGGFR